MTPADFRRIALSLPGAEEGSHMGPWISELEAGFSPSLLRSKKGMATWC